MTILKNSVCWVGHFGLFFSFSFLFLLCSYENQSNLLGYQGWVEILMIILISSQKSLPPNILAGSVIVNSGRQQLYCWHILKHRISGNSFRGKYSSFHYLRENLMWKLPIWDFQGFKDSKKRIVLRKLMTGDLKNTQNWIQFFV